MSKPITKAEMFAAAAKIRNPLAGRVYLAAIAFGTKSPDPDVRHVALSLALGCTRQELEEANEELVRVGLAVELPGWLQ